MKFTDCLKLGVGIALGQLFVGLVLEVSMKLFILMMMGGM